MDSNTKKGYGLINRRRKQWVNEEEVRHAWMKGLEEALQIDLDAERAKREGRSKHWQRWRGRGAEYHDYRFHPGHEIGHG